VPKVEKFYQFYIKKTERSDSFTLAQTGSAYFLVDSSAKPLKEAEVKANESIAPGRALAHFKPWPRPDL
jgi:hypothetical protein